MTRVSPMRTSAWTPPLAPVVRSTSWAPNACFTKSISSMAGRTARYGVTLRMLGVVVVPVAVMVALLARSSPRHALNAGAGRSRRSRAICTSSPSRGSPAGMKPRGSVSARSRASANGSVRDSSLMSVPHASSQGFQRTELELLHRAFTAPQRLGNLANAPLLDEARQHDMLLVVWQASDQIGKHGPAVDVGGFAQVGRRRTPIPRQSLPAVGDGVPGNLEKPGCEWHAAPFEVAEIRQRLMEDFGRQILSFASAA